MTAQHTPVPWNRVATSILDANGGYLADVRDPDDYNHVTDVSTSNAEFIVRAVNSHALMLEALKLAQLKNGLMHAWDCLANVPDCPPHCPVGAVHAAIRAATGEDA